MSLINDALRRADGDKGPRRPAPPVLPPTPRRTRFAPPPPPPPPATREGRGWTSLQAAVLGAALIAVTVAGVLIWKRVGDSPTQVAAASSDPASLSSVLAAAAQAAAQKPAAPEPSSRAGDADNQRSSLVITPARSTQGAKAADPSPPAANLSSSVRDVFASPPTLFMDARKSQTPTAADLPLTPTESPAATLDAAIPSRLASAFIAAARGSPQPAAEKPAAPTGEPPATAPAAPPPPAAAPATVPAAAPAAETPKLKVTSIFYNARSPTAIINGTVAGVGETVEGAKVVAITPRSVDVMVDGKRVTLRL